MANNETHENESESIKPLVEWLKKFDFIYRKLTPEKQFVIGAIATYLYLEIIFNSKNLPPVVQPLIEILEKIPLHELSMWIATLIAFAGSIDGARRIVADQLPFYRAYILVFLFGQKFEDVDDSGQLGSAEQAEPDKLN